MSVPVLLDFRSEQLSVRVPSVDELEHDYVVYDEFAELLRAVDRRRRDQIGFARRFSWECSKIFQEQIATGKLTIYELRSMAESHLQRASSDLAAVGGSASEEPGPEVSVAEEPVPEAEDSTAELGRYLTSG